MKYALLILATPFAVAFAVGAVLGVLSRLTEQTIVHLPDPDEMTAGDWDQLIEQLRKGNA